MTISPPPLSPLPERFKSRICNLYGLEGDQWLSALPALRRSLLERWSLDKVEPISQLAYNYLEYAHSPDHGPVVLKIGFPNPELLTEIKALKSYRELKGAVRLLDWDFSQGAILLKRIIPGQNLTSLSDDKEATRIAAQSMVALRQPKPDGSDFPTMEKWCQGFNRYQDSFREGGGLIPEALFYTAFGLARELLESTEDQFLLHGDLHHSNLLFQEDGSWIAIDPKGIIGEFACEAGPFLYNPVPDLIHQSTLGEVLSHRLEIMEEITGLDKHRLAAWSFCRAVLAAIWSFEEGENNLSYWVKIAEVIEQMVK